MGLIQDLRFALRVLLKERWFTAVAVLSLALGIGANSAIFSLINTLILRPLPVREPARLVELLSNYPGEPRINAFSWDNYGHFRDNNHVLSDLTGTASFRPQVGGEGFAPETVDGEYVPGNFFQTLGVQPAAGRVIGPSDDQLGSEGAASVVLSWSYWRDRFDLDPAIHGRRIVVNGVPATVIGVSARSFIGVEVGSTPDLWAPMAMEALIQRPSGRSNGRIGLKLIGRLKPGVSIDQAQAEMRVLDRPRIEENAQTFRNPLWRKATLDLSPAGAGLSTLRAPLSGPLLALMAAVGLLLLLACTNIAGMMLARGAARHKEMALRVALGASRLQLARQVLTESLLLSTLGGFLAVLVAYVGAGALVRVIASGRPVIGLPERLDIPIEPDARVLLFTAGVAVLAGVLFGLAPAWRPFASAPLPSLIEGRTIGESRSRRFFGKSLVVAQVALSVVLLSAAALFVGHLSNLRNVGVGFRHDSVLLVSLDPADSGYERVQLSNLYKDLLGRLEAIPGVRSATLTGATPISGAGASRFATVEGVQEKPEDRRYLSLNWIGPKYFETLETPLLAGRDFRFEDEGRPRVTIVNQAMARHYFGTSGSAIGKHFTFEGQDQPYEIVGVVGDAKYLNLYEAPPRTAYLNAFQEGRGQFSQFVLRTDVSPTAVVGDVRRVVRDVLKTVPVGTVTTLSKQLDASIVPERLIAMLSELFGALGAVLVAIGLYGLLAYTVARRTSEIGLRMALGATRGDVTAMVLRSALGLVLAGLLVGAPFAIWSPRLLARLVQNLSLDAAFPLAFAAVAMVAVALLAAYVPARRAARVQPIEALRQS
jgi:predicted permease